MLNQTKRPFRAALLTGFVLAALTYGCAGNAQSDGSDTPEITTTIANGGTTIDRGNLPSGAAPGDGSGQGKAPSGADSNSGGGSGNGPGEGNSVGR